MGCSSSKEATKSTFDPDAPPVLSSSKMMLGFGLSPGEAAEVDVPLTDEFEVKNLSNKKEKWVMEQVPSKGFTLEFSPATGTLAKGKTAKVKATLTIHEPTALHFQFRLMTLDGRSVFIQLRVQCGAGVFGVDPSTLDQTTDGTHTVPQVLVDMKNNLGINGAFTQEGIFRLAGDQLEIQDVKQSMNAKGFDFNSELDANSMASLVKIWYRDLPTPIMNHVPKEELMEVADVEASYAAYHSLPDEPKALLSWLLDLLAYTSSFADQNKMTPQNLAICVAPNLYDVGGGNPMEGLFLSQKCAAFLCNVLAARVAGTL